MKKKQTIAAAKNEGAIINLWRKGIRPGSGVEKEFTNDRSWIRKAVVFCRARLFQTLAAHPKISPNPPMIMRTVHRVRERKENITWRSVREPNRTMNTIAAAGE